MSFWSDLFNRGATTVTPNENGPADIHAGDPNGIEILGEPLESRALPVPLPTPWDGWPSDWGTGWSQGGAIDAQLGKLVDIAWACLDLNSNIVSSMPIYRLRDGRIIEPTSWMTNPDPDIYTCWQEFAKQLFWDYQLGEAFVLPWVRGFDNYPLRFRVVPPWLIKVEMRGGKREYTLGSEDITDRVLHIRYHTNTTDPRGHGPLEVAGARQTQIRLLQRYAQNLAETGGVPLYWMEVARRLTLGEAKDLLEQWIETRTANAGHPAIVGSGAKLNQARTMDAKEMGLLEISQFSESRIAVLLGVPPFLVGLAGASGSLTYSNIADLFDFHDRSSLRPKTRMCMQSLSGWALPSGQSIELNRDDYTRLPLNQRAQVYKTLIELKVLTAEEVRIMERFYGVAAPQALTGGTI